MMAELFRWVKSRSSVDPMSAYERKIIHAFSIYQKDKTESISENRHT